MVLYERPLAHGPVVRVRRTTADGELPVVAVLEVDRRAGGARSTDGGGYPPPLLTAEGGSDEAVLNELKPFATNDAELARLLHQRGLR
jgi:hypothetical protein